MVLLSLVISKFAMSFNPKSTERYLLPLMKELWKVSKVLLFEELHIFVARKLKNNNRAKVSFCVNCEYSQCFSKPIVMEFSSNLYLF